MLLLGIPPSTFRYPRNQFHGPLSSKGYNPLVPIVQANRQTSPCFLAHDCHSRPYRFWVSFGVAQISRSSRVQLGPLGLIGVDKVPFQLVGCHPRLCVARGSMLTRPTHTLSGSPQRKSPLRKEALVVTPDGSFARGFVGPRALKFWNLPASVTSVDYGNAPEMSIFNL
jgi:hypothetical protein